MDPQIVSALITAALTIIAGGVGYVFREYRNRAKPFIAITGVEGEFRELSSRVNIPHEIVEAIEPSCFLTKLDPVEYLQYVAQSLDAAKEIETGARDFISFADKIIEAAETENVTMLQSSLSKALMLREYGRWVLTLVAFDKINVPSVNKDLSKKIESYPSSDQEGLLRFSFPGLFPVSFGESFDKEPMLRQKCQPFVELIEFMDVKGLATCFEQFKDCIESELLIAKDVRPVLQKIVDENSMWLVQIYVANLGKNPFLISKEGHLHVEDETGAKYEETCQLVLLSYKEDGSVSRNRATSPLVLGSEKDAQFAYVTTKVQGQMKRGQAFREVFSSNSARCWVEFGIEKVGFRRHQQLKTPRAKFRATNE